MLNDTDFHQLMVGDADDNGPRETNEANYQCLFNKPSSQPVLTFQQMASRFFQLQDSVKLGAKCLLSQLMLEANRLNVANMKLSRESNGLKKHLEQAKIGFNKLKMHFKSQKAEYDRKITMLNKKVEEKEEQLMKFRQIHSDRTTSPRVVQTRHRHHHAGPPQVSGHNSVHQPEPPLRGLLERTAANDQRDLGLNSQRNRPIIGGGMSNPYSVAGQKRQYSHTNQHGYTSDESRSGRSNGSYTFTTQDHGGQNSRRRLNQQASASFGIDEPQSPSMLY